MTKRKKYYCRYCGKVFDTFYMAEICFELDMKLLEYEKTETYNTGIVKRS